MGQKQLLTDRSFSRRKLIKWGGAGMTLAALNCRAWPGYARSNIADGIDPFVTCVNAFQQSHSTLERFMLSLPELQVAPLAQSVDSVFERERLFNQLSEELLQTPVADIAIKAFPMTVRYPAWLALAISLELFELVLENSRLPEFELPGVAREHMLPYTAVIDLALIPLCGLLRTPFGTLSDQDRAQVADRLELLRGRLLLLGDPTLLRIAKQLQKLFILDKAPVLLRTFANLLPEGTTPGFQASYQQQLPAGELVWWFLATPAEWEKIIRRRDRALDKVVKSMFIGQLFTRCT